ncbi:MAG: CDP-2,3-bis-(O-geranylgeranyl)-sn-glycerol synthase [Candidatus Micrarchaeia archaeon]
MQFGADMIIYSIIFILPAYVANSAPVLLGGTFPIDFGISAWDKHRLFGKGKTWLGLLGGMSAGMLVSVLEAYFLSGTSLDIFGSNAQLYLIVGMLLSAGALFGDLFGSFIKRRMGIVSGAPSALDQLTFLVFALLFVYPLGLGIIFSPACLIFLFLFTYLLHRVANGFAHLVGLKRVPW